MSCNACLRQFGFFCKEAGCPNCGFSFCTKCLKKVATIPKLGNTQHKVCLSCWEKLENQSKTANPTSKTSIGVSPLDDPIPDEIQNDLDDVIQKRLTALKQPIEPVTIGDPNLDTDTGIAIRIANLKDIPYTSKDNSDILTKVDRRTDEEKTADLIKQFLQESEIDTSLESHDPVHDIEKRLAALRGDDAGKSNVRKTDNSDSENEDEETKIRKLSKRYLEEAKLPDTGLQEELEEAVAIADSCKSEEKLEELPWCHICNEDATIRCMGCDGDLFCKNCFKEFHDEEDYRTHQQKPYVGKVQSEGD